MTVLQVFFHIRAYRKKPANSDPSALIRTGRDPSAASALSNLSSLWQCCETAVRISADADRFAGFFKVAILLGVVFYYTVNFWLQSCYFLTLRPL